MAFWKILKCIFRCIISLDLRPHNDDVYDDQGNLFVFGPWLDQAMVIFDIVLVFLGIITFALSWLYSAYLTALWIRWILISLCLLLPPFLSAGYVAIKRMVFLKKQKQQKDE